MFELDSNLFNPLIHKLIAELQQKKATLSLAESCTGGLLSSLITHIPGCSSVYRGGVCVYSNDLKVELLGVPKHLIEKYGAVSKEVAEAMATGAGTILKSDYSISVTGIAGPSGGSKEKPVGTIWCATYGPKGTVSQHFQLQGDRTQNRAEISLLAIDMILRYI